MTWAIETGTLQYIEGQVIGMSVLGGNLLIIGQDGLMRLAWENQEAPLVCGLYTHSVVFKEKIFFIPYLSRQIVCFDYRSKRIASVDIPGRLPNERLYSWIQDNELYLTAIKSGRIYQYQEGKGFRLMEASWEGGDSFLPKRDLAEGRKQVLQRKTEEAIEFSVYDCVKNVSMRFTAPDCALKDFIWDEDHIWYASDEAVYEINITERSGAVMPEKIFDFDCKRDFVSFVMKGRDSFFMLAEKSNGFYEFRKSSKDWKKSEYDFLDADKNMLAYRISAERVLIRQFDIRDWMIRPGERYGIFHLFSEDYTEIPLFALEEPCAKLLDRNYIKSVWSVAPDHVLAENEREGLEFLLATLDEEVKT